MTIKIGEYPGRPYRLAPEQMSAGQADLVRRILTGPRKDLPVNMEIWLHNLPFAEVANRFAEYVGQLAPMTRRVKEITILVVAAHLKSQFEWYWHARLGTQLGLSETQLGAMQSQQGALFDDPVEQVAHDLAVAWTSRRGVDDELHTRAMNLLGHAQVADLIGLIGLYVMVGYSLDFYKVPVPD